MYTTHQKFGILSKTFSIWEIGKVGCSQVNWLKDQVNRLDPSNKCFCISNFADSIFLLARFVSRSANHKYWVLRCARCLARFSYTACPLASLGGSAALLFRPRRHTPPWSLRILHTYMSALHFRCHVLSKLAAAPQLRDGGQTRRKKKWKND